MMKKSRLLFLITFGLILAVTGLLSGPTPALALAPTATSATPNQGDQGQSLSVAIAGTDFTGATSVSFGPGVTTNGLTVDNATRITANITIDAGAAVGARDVSVTNIDGTGTLTSGFTVNQAPPVIESVNPHQGLQGQTDNVTITGTHFTGTTSVDFGPGITTNSFVVTPLSGPSQVQVGTGTAAVTYPFYTWWCDTRTQSILLASEIGQPGEIQKLRVYCSTRPGQNLSHFYIRMQHTAMTSFSSSSYVNSGWTTVLHATNVNVAAWTVPGWVEFEFTTPFDYDGVSNLLIDYCVDNSYYTSSGACYSTTATNRTIYTYSDVYSGNLLNTIGGTRASWYNNVVLVLQNADTIDANITIDGAASPGYRDVSVTTPEGTDTEVDGFMVLAMPTISSVNPSQAVQGQALSVTITGTNLLGVTTVGFGSGITVTSFTVDNATQITASIAVSGSATVGTRDVWVTNAAGTATLTSGFTVNQAPPTISSVNPNQGPQGQTLDVTIGGSYFTGASAVSFGPDITTNSFTVNSGTQITANITIGGSATPGLRNVSVSSPGGTGTLTDGFRVVAAPTISSVTPSQAVQGQALSVTITGTNLLGVTTVGFGSGITVNTFTADNDTQMTAIIAVSVFAVTGPRDVSVASAIGTATRNSGFTVNQAPPTISSVNPNQGPQGQTLDVTIGGSYFTGASAVSFGPDTTVNSYNVNNSGQIVANITIGGSATPGPRNVSVTTPVGTATQTDGFTVLTMPTISSVNPSQAVQGQALSVTITGTNLVGVTTVGFGSGITVNSFTVDNGTQITASIAVSGSDTVGTRDVSVTTPVGAATLTNGFMVVATTTISSVSPSQAVQGQALSVTITGTNLLGATTVGFGSGITTSNFSVNSATQITVTISISRSASTGARDVSVTTPSGVVTKTTGFTVTQQGTAPDETPNDSNTDDGGGGIPFWIWIIVGVAAVLGLGVGTYLIGKRRPAKPQQ